jgi:hypothetical protein
MGLLSSSGSDCRSSCGTFSQFSSIQSAERDHGLGGLQDDR